MWVLVIMVLTNQTILNSTEFSSQENCEIVRNAINHTFKDYGTGRIITICSKK